MDKELELRLHAIYDKLSECWICMSVGTGRYPQEEVERVALSWLNKLANTPIPTEEHDDLKILTWKAAETMECITEYAESQDAQRRAIVLEMLQLVDTNPFNLIATIKTRLHITDSVLISRTIREAVCWAKDSAEKRIIAEDIE